MRVVVFTLQNGFLWLLLGNSGGRLGLLLWSTKDSLFQKERIGHVKISINKTRKTRIGCWNLLEWKWGSHHITQEKHYRVHEKRFGFDQLKLRFSLTWPVLLPPSEGVELGPELWAWAWAWGPGAPPLVKIEPTEPLDVFLDNGILVEKDSLLDSATNSGRSSEDDDDGSVEPINDPTG